MARQHSRRSVRADLDTLKQWIAKVVVYLPTGQQGNPQLDRSRPTSNATRSFNGEVGSTTVAVGRPMLLLNCHRRKCNQSEPVRIDPLGFTWEFAWTLNQSRLKATPALTFLERLQRRPLAITTLMFRQSNLSRLYLAPLAICAHGLSASARCRSALSAVTSAG